MNLFNRIHYSSNLLIICNISIGILLLIFLLFFIRDIISTVPKGGVKSTNASYFLPHRYEKKAFQEYESILKNNPFGFPAGSLKLLSSPSAQSDKTTYSSDIKLIGTISGGRFHNYAVFTDKDGKQDIFKKGESVFGLGKLNKVDKYKVSIKQEDKLIEIPMTEAIIINDSGISRVNMESSDFAEKIGRGEYIVNQKALLYNLDNPNEIMTDARLVPNITSDGQSCFILKEIKKNGIYGNLGLQNGDVLLRINDYNISTPENALQAFTALRGMDSVNLDILRGDSKMTMTYQIR